MLRIFILSLLLPVSALAAGLPDDWCAAIGKRLHSVPESQCRELGMQAAQLRSAQGYPLMWRDIAPAKRQFAERGGGRRAPRVLVIGGMHGDELTSAALVLRWLPWMRQGDAVRYHWRVVPVANPDGLFAQPPQRGNGNGVDLNRNFPTPGWQAEAHLYWQKRTGRDPRRYPGAQAASERETRWLAAEIDRFAPDVIVSVHAPYGLLDYDGPASHPHRFGRLSLKRLGVYPGSLGNYGGVHKNISVVTIELPSATKMPVQQEQLAIWRDMLRWLRRNAGVSVG